MAFVIGIDFDDVLVATANEVIRIYNEKYGTQLTPADWFSDFGDMSIFNTDDPKEVTRRVIAIQSSKECIEATKPLVGANAVLKKLKAAGHRLIVITGRPETNRTATVASMEEHYAGILSAKDLFFTDHYKHDGERLSKGDIALELGLTHFIDDLVDHVNDVASRGVRSLLFNNGYDWNGEAPEIAPEVVKVASWQEIGEFFANE